MTVNHKTTYTSPNRHHGRYPFILRSLLQLVGAGMCLSRVYRHGTPLLQVPLKTTFLPKIAIQNYSLMTLQWNSLNDLSYRYGGHHHSITNTTAGQRYQLRNRRHWQWLESFHTKIQILFIIFMELQIVFV